MQLRNRTRIWGYMENRLGAPTFLRKRELRSMIDSWPGYEESFLLRSDINVLKAAKRLTRGCDTCVATIQIYTIDAYWLRVYGRGVKYTSPNVLNSSREHAIREWLRYQSLRKLRGAAASDRRVAIIRCDWGRGLRSRG